MATQATHNSDRDESMDIPRLEGQTQHRTLPLILHTVWSSSVGIPWENLHTPPICMTYISHCMKYTSHLYGIRCAYIFLEEKGKGRPRPKFLESGEILHRPMCLCFQGEV